MAHLDVEPVFVQHDERFLERGPHVSVSPLPVLLFQHLRREELFPVALLVRCPDPELELGRGGHDDLLDIVYRVSAVYIIKNIWVLAEILHYLFLEVPYRVPERRSRSALERVVMHKE